MSASNPSNSGPATTAHRVAFLACLTLLCLVAVATPSSAAVSQQIVAVCAVEYCVLVGGPGVIAICSGNDPNDRGIGGFDVRLNDPYLIYYPSFGGGSDYAGVGNCPPILDPPAPAKDEEGSPGNTTVEEGAEGT